MKNWIHYSALMLSLSIGSCSSENDIVEESHLDGEITEIVAKMGALQTKDAVSRTAINMGEFESDFISLVWAEKDTIGIYPVTGDQLSFPITDGIGTNTCTFNGGGWALKTSTSYTAYSPFSRAYYYKDVTELPVSMLGQKQVGNGSSAHIGKYDLQIAKGETPENGKITFDFEHQVCFIRMDLTAPVAGTWKSITLKTDGAFTTEATMDLSQEVPVITPTSTANSVTLKLDGVTTTDENPTITAYMVVLPVDLQEKKLEVELQDSNGNVHYVDAEVAHDYRNFKPGYARWIKAAYEADVNGVYKDGVASITNVGNLKSILGEDFLNITSLKIVGPINGTDVACLRRMLGGNDYEETEWGKLTTLDLSKATIVEGGDAYYSIGGTYNTSNNQIGGYMFHKCANLQSMVLPDNATSIGERAFQNCDAMTSITIGNGILSIGGYAFYDCGALNTIYMGDKVHTIGGYAFGYCDAIASVYINDLSAWCKISFGSLFEGAASPLRSEAKLYLNNQELTELTIPEDVTEIRNFANCKTLVKVEIPEHVTSIDDSAFSGCSSLTSVTIGDGVTSIGRYAFSGCSSLTSIVIPDNVTSISSDALIDSYLFSGCSSLVSVTIGDGVTSIGRYAFSGCSSLELVTIGDNVTSIGNYAFNSCSSLESINIPDDVTSIGDNAFDGCVSLTSFTIPKGVKYLGYKAFQNCSSLAQCYCYATTIPSCNVVNGSPFFNIKNGAILYVPKGCVDSYGSSNWATYFSEIKEMEE